MLPYALLCRDATIALVLLAISTSIVSSVTPELKGLVHAE